MTFNENAALRRYLKDGEVFVAEDAGTPEGATKGWETRRRGRGYYEVSDPADASILGHHNVSSEEINDFADKITEAHGGDSRSFSNLRQTVHNVFNGCESATEAELNHFESIVGEDNPVVRGMRAYQTAEDGVVEEVSVAEDYIPLEQHDRIYHKGGYREGDKCNVREAIQKSDSPDKMVAKAKKMESRVAARENKEMNELLMETFGGEPQYTGDDDFRDAGRVEFTIELPRPKTTTEQERQHRLEYSDWIIEKKFEDKGYDLSYRISNIGTGSGKKIVGAINRKPASKMFEKVKSQKPEWDHDGSYQIDGQWYFDHDEAMEAWKSAMKKYGAQAKKEVSVAGVAADETPAARYLAACQDWAPVKRHADGSVCKAQSPDACPFNKSAEAGEKAITGKETAKGKEGVDGEVDIDARMKDLVDDGFVKDVLGSLDSWRTRMHPDDPGADEYDDAANYVDESDVDEAARIILEGDPDFGREKLMSETVKYLNEQARERAR